MEGSIVFFVMVLLVYVAVPKRQRREDPLHRGPAVAEEPRRKRGPAINERMKDAAWAETFVGVIATKGPETLYTDDVRRLYREIVNNDDLSKDTKHYLLDGLSQRTENYHVRGMGAAVLEEISNESIALDHPEWHGRHGDWNSVKGQ